MGRKRKDLTGTTRGKLTVISFDEEKKKWMCKCECGNTAFFTPHEWAMNEPSSCGCFKHRKDITGNRYGMLTAISPTGDVDQHGDAYWNCKCDCGNTIVVSMRNLRYKSTKSCGCLKIIQGKKLGGITRNHCIDGSDPYKLYGDKPRKNNKTGYRGVYIEKRTKRYAAEITFKGKRYHIGQYDTAEEAHDAYLKAKEKLHEPYLQDIFNSNPEEKNKVEQMGIIKKQRKTLVYYTPENRYVNIPELSKLSGVNKVTLYSRLKKGYTGEELWSTKLPNKRKANTYMIYNGKSVSISELASLTGISKETLRYRYNHGYRGEELCEKQGHSNWIDYKGDRIPLTELSIRTGIGYGTLKMRYKNGKRGEELWKQPKVLNDKIFVEYDGRKVSLQELSKITGIAYSTLHKRYNDGHQGKELYKLERNKISVNYNGDKITLKELSNRTGISYITLAQRYYNGDRGDYLWRPLYAKRKIK